MSTENEKLINEEYKIWKKNSPFLYDLVITHAFKWPSLTCQWLPTVERVPDRGYKLQRLLLGTHTNDDDPNYLQVATVRIPDATDIKTYENSVQDLDEEDAHIQTTQRIVHDGEVNRARYKVDQPDLVATKSRSGDVYIFRCSTFPMDPEDTHFNPTLRLKGHSKEGYGLAWNPHVSKSSHLLSAGFDSLVCEWDVDGTEHANKEIQPLRTYKGHTAGVEDVAWHGVQDHLFASVGDDKRLMIWDTRKDGDEPAYNLIAHESEVNCVSFAPKSEWILATGSGDHTAAIWDMRNMKEKVHSLVSHQSEILQLQWAPLHDSVLATASNDRRILVWDISRIGQGQTEVEAEDGPPELLFMHGGHTNKIADFDWNPSQPWTLASTAEDNIVQTWQMASHVYASDQDADKMEE
ncbi:WD40 repeat-like protein [Hesseltinella vesiculosa]|uniref:WD40 repeat-like protein n=1 Tax=Hesseltinella vesiculosa TaxID=101127 RepID=A0A1X2GUN3_9FUNG|nr:WD40 repeat-like protein [Hesseltinella vesiculosa]